MQRMQIGSISVDVIRKDIKNIHLAVYPPSGRIRLASPMDVRDETLRLFTIAKLAWIKRQQRKFQTQERESKREYVSRESHYLFGKRYMLKVAFHDAPPRIELVGQTMLLYVREQMPAAKRHGFVKIWHRSMLQAKVQPLLTKWETKIGVKASKCDIRLMKTLWGSCTPRNKRICLNLELAKKPTKCIEYIIAHELTHLKERHHNARFVKLMNEAMPKWKMYRDELNRLPVSHRDWGY